MAKKSKAAPAGPDLKVPIVVKDYDHTETERSPARKDITFESESEVAAAANVVEADEHARRLAEAWAERCAKEGKKFFYCPFEPEGKKRVLFTTKKACAAYMAKTYKMRIAEAKLTNQPASTYTPQVYIESPKITAADLVLPEFRARVAASEATREAIKPLLNNPRSQGSVEFKAVTLLVLPESIATTRLGRLDDNELRKATRMAESRSKRTLFRGCVAEAKKRGLSLV